MQRLPATKPPTRNLVTQRPDVNEVPPNGLNIGAKLRQMQKTARIGVHQEAIRRALWGAGELVTSELMGWCYGEGPHPLWKRTNTWRSRSTVCRACWSAQWRDSLEAERGSEHVNSRYRLYCETT